jgi:hypothetical protein
MTNELFSRLLYEEESPTLDFKKEQYPFVRATEMEKSELLKDILGFANGWRRGTAYILIGVADVRGGRSEPVGILDSHLDDHALQQFFHHLTSQPIRFTYKAFPFEGKQFGVISIEDEHPRPIYLKRDYGKLKAEKVYLRRGTSTDPSKPATLEEIAAMGATSRPMNAELRVEFAAAETDAAIGMSIDLTDIEYCEVPEQAEIGNYPRTPSSALRQYRFATQPYQQAENKEYYRATASYERWRRLLRPISLFVQNLGGVRAEQVLLEITIPMSTRILVRNELDEQPKTTRSLLDMPSLRSLHHAHLGAVSIGQTRHQWKLAIDCGDLQPGRGLKTDDFYVGMLESGQYTIEGRIFADNLPMPQPFSLGINAAVTKTSLSLDDLYSM